MGALLAVSASAALLLASAAAAAGPAKADIPNGLSLRAMPLLGKIDVRGHYEVEAQRLAPRQQQFAARMRRPREQPP